MINNSLIRISPCKLTDLELLNKCASADGHAVIAPTFLIEKGPQVVGYLGLVPSVLVWLDTQRTNVRDSLCVMNFYENVLRQANSEIIGVPCVPNSPLKPFLPRVGYVDSGATLFLKNINER